MRIFQPLNTSMLDTLIWLGQGLWFEMRVKGHIITIRSCTHILSLTLTIRVQCSLCVSSVVTSLLFYELDFFLSLSTSPRLTLYGLYTEVKVERESKSAKRIDITHPHTDTRKVYRPSIALCIDNISRPYDKITSALFSAKKI